MEKIGVINSQSTYTTYIGFKNWDSHLGPGSSKIKSPIILNLHTTLFVWVDVKPQIKLETLISKHTEIFRTYEQPFKMILYEVSRFQQPDRQLE